MSKIFHYSVYCVSLSLSVSLVFFCLSLRTPNGPNQCAWHHILAHILASLKLTMTKINGRAKCQTNQSQLRAVESENEAKGARPGQARKEGQGRRSCGGNEQM